MYVKPGRAEESSHPAAMTPPGTQVLVSRYHPPRNRSGEMAVSRTGGKTVEEEPGLSIGT